MNLTLKPELNSQLLNAMNFLNEVVLNYPKAVSFAPGRPWEEFFDVADVAAKVPIFADYYARTTGRTKAGVLKLLGQYGKTTGIIQDLIARHLERDEAIQAKPETIMVTCGCQEAMAILLMTLFDSAQDVLLVSDPSYIGITGTAQVLGITLWPVSMRDGYLDLAALEAEIAAVRAAGKRPRAFYHIPDFNNPLGISMPIEDRGRLLEIASAQQVLIFEDNPYGMFAYDGPPKPTLKSLDRSGMVIYLGTFSKTLFPGLRVGYLIADQTVGEGAQGHLLIDDLSKVKSFLSVNTSPLLQAMAGAILEACDGHLTPRIAPMIEFYRANRDRMLDCLAQFLAEKGVATGTVTWNRPGGGFFLYVQLPFTFGEADMRLCADRYGVIVCPMSLFSLRSGYENQIRLSFSYVDQAQIETGIRGLVNFISDRLEGAGN